MCTIHYFAQTSQLELFHKKLQWIGMFFIAQLYIHFLKLYTDNEVTVFIATIMNGNYIIFFYLKCLFININSIVLA